MNDAPTAPAQPETLGDYIRAKREAAGLSRERFAGKIGVSASAVQQWETNATIPSPRALHFLARDIDGIDASEMLALIPPGAR